MRSIHTRFRAYHLGTSGSSFSYFAGEHFTMIEGRLTEESRPQVEREMENCGVDSADLLHITNLEVANQASREPVITGDDRAVHGPTPAFARVVDKLGYRELEFSPPVRHFENNLDVVWMVAPEHVMGDRPDM